MSRGKTWNLRKHLDDLYQLLEILEAHDTGLICEKIAVQMNLEQSFVSRRRLAVVDFLKDPVLEAGGPQGDRLTKRARSFAEALRHAKTVLDAAVGNDRFGSVEIRVGTIPSVLSSFLPRVLAALTDGGYFVDFPKVAVFTESGPAATLFEQLDRGLLDMVITYPLLDVNLDSEVEKKARGEDGEGGWRPMQFNPWNQSREIHERPLFVGKPVGLIYHASNRAMAKLAARPSAFSFQPLRSMFVLLTSDSRQPAFEAEVEKWLPEPTAKEGTRIHLQSFNQIRAAIRDGGAAFREKAVGVGVQIENEPDIEFLDFRTIAKRLRVGSAAAPAVHRLARLCTQTFNLYRKSARSRPAVLSDYFRAFAKGVEDSVEGYNHPYVS